MAILVHYSGSQAKKCFLEVEEQDYKSVSSFEQFWRLSFQLPYFRVACQMTQGVNNGTICSEMIPSGATTTNTA